MKLPGKIERPSVDDVGIMAISAVALTVFVAYAAVTPGLYRGRTAPVPETPDHAAAPAATPAPVATPRFRAMTGTTGDAAGTFQSEIAVLDYIVEGIGHGASPVPRTLPARLPRALRSVTTEQRKTLFIKLILPLVVHANAAIRADRARLSRLAERMASGRPLDAGDTAWVTTKMKRYQVSRGGIDELLRRVDTVPVSLALAQAAVESGWGTSRFAQTGQALFGQWTYDPELAMVPQGREDYQKHGIQRFRRLLDSTEAYMRNLNTHPAYADFRAARARMREAAGGRLDALGLAKTLLLYSERGEAYVSTVRTVIQANRLYELDDAVLDEDGGERLVADR